MAANSTASTSTPVTAYPINNFRFEVIIEKISGKIPATSVSGMSSSINPIKYRVGSDQQLTEHNMPGKPEAGSLSIKCLVYAQTGDYLGIDDLQKAFDDVYSGDLTLGQITVNVLGLDGNIVTTGTFDGCLLTKFSVTDLNSTGAEVWNADLEFSYDTMKLASAAG